MYQVRISYGTDAKILQNIKGVVISEANEITLLHKTRGYIFISLKDFMEIQIKPGED